MSVKQKHSLGIVVADIDFFFSHRIELAKIIEKYQILVISDLRNSNKSKLANSFIKFITLSQEQKINYKYF